MPTCIETESTYQAEDEGKRCNQDVSQYDEEMQGYIQCLEGSVEKATRVKQQVQDAYRCRRDGGADCPPIPGPEANL